MPITRRAAKRIFREVGAWRISDSAADELAIVMHRFAYGIAKKAVQLAAHAKRKTVKKSDVELAK